MGSLIDPFEYHGFEQVGATGDQVYGNCPFCEKKNHFYIGKTGQYDCKVCGASGNAVSFLSNFLAAQRKRTTKSQLLSLSRERGIPLESLRNYGVARRWDGAWLIPYYSEKSTIRDIRVWRLGGGARSTKGCKTQLLGMDVLASARADDPVYVCEGEWDAMALSSVLGDKGVVVAVPGASIFKEEWLQAFRGRSVYFCFDNDNPGQHGAEKAAAKLASLARETFILRWPEEFASGFDVRDLFKEMGPSKTLKAMGKLFQKFTKASGGAGGSTLEGIETEIFQPHPIGEPEDGYPTLEETLARYRKFVCMSPDMENGLRIMFAHAFSTQVSGDPLWSYIVSPPGGGKTLLLMSLRGSERIMYNSTMTPQSLVSGFQSGADPSLLPQWHGKCAVLKDFTEMMAAHPTAKEELYGTLRGAYDGHVKKNFGNGVVREYWLRFGLLAGVTPAINGDKRAMMGERFLKYEMLKGSDWSADVEIMTAINNISHENSIESELIDAAGAFLARPCLSLPEIPLWAKHRVVALAQLIAALRANVEREAYGEQKLLYRPVREVGTRLAKQLVKLSALLAFVEGKPAVDEAVYALVERVAFDTAIGFHLDIVQALMRRGGACTRKELSHELELPETTLGRALEDLRMLGAVNRVAASDSGGVGRPGSEWGATDFMADLWNRSQVRGDAVEQAKAVRASRVTIRKRK